MKRMLFRAKRTDNGEWVYWNVYGELVAESGKRTRVVVRKDATTSCYDYIYQIRRLLDESTICQYAGLTDKNGRKIWENDVCKYFNQEDKDGVAIIKYDYASWVSGTISEKETLTPLFYLQCGDEWEVIGNVFDNPELLKEGAVCE